jgi:hypothetical protein
MLTSKGEPVPTRHQGWNPRPLGVKPASNRLNHGTAIRCQTIIISIIIIITIIIPDVKSRRGSLSIVTGLRDEPSENQGSIPVGG